MILDFAPHLISDLAGAGPPRRFRRARSGEVRRGALGIPVFGVCLGLQGIVEAFGGELGVLDYPMHGKPSTVRASQPGRSSKDCPKSFRWAATIRCSRRKETFPACLEVTAESEDGVIMGVRHRELPIEAVQFHPESILTLDGNCGVRLIENVVAQALASPAVHSR